MSAPAHIASPPVGAGRVLTYGVWLFIGLVWGTTWAVIRVGLRDLPPLTFAALRTALAAVALLAAAQLMQPGRRPAGAELRFWMLVGLPQMAIPYALIFWAEQWISSGLTAVLFGTFPVFTAVAAHFLLAHEPLTVRKLAGTLLGMVAVVVVVGPGAMGNGAYLLPVLGVLVASVSGSIAAVLVRRHGRHTSTLWLTTIQIASGAVILAVLAAAVERGQGVRFTTSSVASIAYLGLVVTVGCYSGLFWLLKRLDATFVSMGVVLEVTVAVLLGAALLGERLGLNMLVGLVLVGFSVALVTRRRQSDVPLGPPA